MKIAVIADRLKTAGGLSVALALYKSKTEIDHLITFVIPEDILGIYEQDKSKELIPIKSSLFTRSKELRKVINELRPDYVLNLTNIPVGLKEQNEYVLVMWPYLFNRDSMVWSMMSYKERYYKLLKRHFLIRRLKGVKIIAQTKTAKQRMSGLNLNVVGVVNMVPPDYPKNKLKNEIRGILNQHRKKYSLLTLSKYYAHKGFQILPDIASHFPDCVFYVTLNMLEVPISLAEKIENTPNIINLGVIPFDQVDQLNKNVDAYLLPTLLESFSSVYADSLTNNIPCITSDLDFAREALGDRGFFAKPFNVLSFVDAIHNAKKHYRKPYILEERNMMLEYLEILNKRVYEANNTIPK